MMEQISEFVDERHKGFCIHCGITVTESNSNRDHVPSKCLLKRPFPRNLPVVQICKACNEGFSKDEEYLTAFLGCVFAGSSDPSEQILVEAQRILQRNEGLRQRIEGSKREVKTLDGETRLFWDPEGKRARRVLIKNGRGHAFYELGEPVLNNPTDVWWSPLESLTVDQRTEFEES